MNTLVSLINTYEMSKEVKDIDMKQLLPTSGVKFLSFGADPQNSELQT